MTSHTPKVRRMKADRPDATRASTARERSIARKQQRQAKNSARSSR